MLSLFGDWQSMAECPREPDYPRGTVQQQAEARAPPLCHCPPPAPHSQLRPLLSLSHGGKGQSLRHQAEHEAQPDMGHAQMTCHGDLWASLEPFPPGDRFI